MSYRAGDRHNMMGGRGFRVEQLKIRTFVFRFLGLVTTVPSTQEEKSASAWATPLASHLGVASASSVVQEVLNISTYLQS